MNYSYRRIKSGNSRDKVALLISISGSINSNDIPQKIQNSHYIYEIVPSNAKQTPMILKRVEDLSSFKQAYQEFLRHIHSEHPNSKVLKLFPSVPLSIAVCCGSERLPRVDPSLEVYDYNKNKNVFVKCINVR